MKHLEKFFEYIRESREVSNDDLEDILVPRKMDDLDQELLDDSIEDLEDDK